MSPRLSLPSDTTANLDPRGKLRYNRLRRFEWRDTILPTDRVKERRALRYSSVYNQNACACVARARDDEEI